MTYNLLYKYNRTKKYTSNCALKKQEKPIRDEPNKGKIKEINKVLLF